ncbi:MFS general substrate transporter [Phaeosphaeriaceae sp. SRC1lsM3a]|nr:MFS general substrate transporter [Stagonospora sp. SRC1lsM3a]
MARTNNKEVTLSNPAPDDMEYPPFKVVLPAMAAIWLAFFVVALDRTIIGTAVPTISQQFQSFGDIAWYESGFLLPFCVLQLSFGRIYRYYSAKWTMVISIAIFEVGSIICAAAPSSKALIVGRVISGIGGAGVTPGAFLLVIFLVPMQARPKYIGSLGRPILGGYLTSVTWRWCFWINLPVGGISMVLLILLTPKCPPPVKRASTWKGKFFELDPFGFLLVAISLVCLLLAIQFGGKEYSWGSGVVIALFVIAGSFGIAFVGFQIWRGEKGTVPPQIISQRSILAGTVASLGIGSVLVLLAFYLPIWFQVVQGKSPQNSGLSLIPLLLSVVVAVIASGIVTSKIGYYVPALILGAALAIVGAGFISTWSVDVGSGKWIGFQVVAGIGLGLVLQGPNIAAQTVLSKQDVSIGLSIINLANFLGSTLFVTVAQALLQNQLVKSLKPILPNANLSEIATSGANSLREEASGEQLRAVLVAYNGAIRSVWYLALGLACLVLLASLGMEWRSVKGQSPVNSENHNGSEDDEKNAGQVEV